MRINTLIKLVALVPLLLAGCKNDIEQVPLPIGTPMEQLQEEESHYYKPSDTYLQTLDALTDPSTLNTRHYRQWTEIAAGSHNALAAAIRNTQAGGVIYLKRGVHTETNPLTISKSVTIVGETGAKLKVKSQLSLLDGNGNYRINPFLHFLNAPQSVVLNVEIQPLDTDGSTAILFENSHESALVRCKITNFQTAVIIEKSNRVAIMKNVIVATSAWQTNATLQTQSIILMNGLSAYVGDNDVSNSAIGIWPCDKWGTCERNYTHHNFIGVILCKVAQFIILPNGRLTGSPFPATGWSVYNNNSTDNFNIGYIVADGSNHNILKNNNAARNALYDMELLSDTYRFGFLIPFVYNNTVYAGAYQNIRIKDCGKNNKVFGGIHVNTASDPCN